MKKQAKQKEEISDISSENKTKKQQTKSKENAKKTYLSGRADVSSDK